MNERIKELVVESGNGLMRDGKLYPHLGSRTTHDWEKFAELIVDQMLEITDAHTEVFQTDRDRGLIEHIKKSVKQHFGVKE
jgi:hypothetical protein